MAKMSGGLRLKYRGGKQFEQEMRQAAKDVNREFKREAREVAKEFRGESRTEVPVDSGQLRSSLKHFTRGGRDGATFGVRSNLVYAPALHYGQRGRFSSLVERYGPRPRFTYDVREQNSEEYARRLAEAVARVAEQVSALQKG